MKLAGILAALLFTTVCRASDCPAPKSWANTSRTGQVVIAPTFDLAWPFVESHIAMVKVGGKFGWIDSSGAYVIRPQFDEVSGFWSDEGLMPVKVGGPHGKWGYIDRFGKIVIDPRFDWAGVFTGGAASVKIGDDVLYIDRNGSPVSSVEAMRRYEAFFSQYSAQHRRGVQFVVDYRTSNKWGMEVDGSIIPNRLFDWAGEFDNCLGLGLVRIGDGESGTFGFVDRTGKFVINPTYANASGFSENLAPVQVGDKRTGQWGFIDTRGNVVIAPSFEDAGGFSEGLAPVVKNGKEGFIDSHGDFVVPPVFDVEPAAAGVARLFPFVGGKALVYANGKWGYISR